MIPSSIKRVLTEEHNLRIVSSHRLSGGDINRAARLITQNGDYFIKWNDDAPNDMFAKEARGLNLLRNAGTVIIVPKILTTQSPTDKTPGFLVMEYVKPGNGSSDDSFQFGSELAKLHQSHSDYFGLDHDNYIGRLPQSNSPRPSWSIFFIEERIKPQLKAAVDSGKLPNSTLKNSSRLYSELSSIFPESKPSLLHGDLWSGNYFFNSGGRAVLIDPAVYYGHPEMDLAFTRMFGGFSTEFYEGYKSVTPIEKGFESRISVYNLYPLLVHVNLFGGGYAGQAEQFLNRF